MKLSGRQIILLTLLGMLVVGGLGLAIYHWRAKTAVANYRKQLIAAGEKLTIKELIPPIPAKEEDGAELFHKAMALMNTPSKDMLSTNPPSSMRAIAPGKAAVSWQQPDIRNGEATNSWDDVADAVAETSVALSLLDQLAEKKTLDFKPNYNLGFLGLPPMLAPQKQAAQSLSVAIIFALHEGDSESATTHLRALLGLVRGSQDNRFIVSQLVRFAIVGIAQASSWDFLQTTNATDTQLVAVQRDWMALDFALPTERALEIERAMCEMTIGNMRGSRAEFSRVTIGFGVGAGGGAAGASDFAERVSDFVKDTWGKTKEGSKEAAWRLAWSYPDQLRMLKGSQVHIETLRSARSNGNFSAAIQIQRSRLGELGIANVSRDLESSIYSNLQTLFTEVILYSDRLINNVMVIEAGKQLTVTAIALKRHKLRHGNFPADLAALVPEFLPAVPLDPVNAQPLHYKPNADGTFLLYSIGEDAEDNGGDPTPTNPKTFWWQCGRDWVWPQPANAQEIEDYFQQRRGK